MNKDKRNNIQLLGTLNNADESGIIANASQIYDGVANKSVEERITDLDNKIESGTNAKIDYIGDDNYVYRWNPSTSSYEKTSIYVKGDKGDQGIQGVKGNTGDTGATGKDGISSYLHIAYADDITGGGFSQNPAGKNYIGTYVDHTATDSTKASDYKWQLVKGAQGDKGDKGEKGDSVYTGDTGQIVVVNDLVSGGAEKALSAEQGKILDEKINVNTAVCEKFTDNLIIKKGDNNHFLDFCDENGNLVFYVDDDFTFHALGNNSDESDDDEIPSKGLVKALIEAAIGDIPIGDSDVIVKEGDNDHLLDVCDENGNLLFYVDSDFTFHALNTSLSFHLPDTINSFVGDTLQIFYYPTLLSPNYKHLGVNMFVSGDALNCKSLTRYAEYTPTSAGTKTMKFNVLDDSLGILASKTVPINVITPTSPSSMKNILLIGDSETEGYVNNSIVSTSADNITKSMRYPYAKELMRILTSSDAASSTAPAGLGLSNIQLIGHLRGDVRHEGYGGRKASWFLGTSSPFYVNGAIDFNAYLAQDTIYSDTSKKGVDYIYILLGANDGVTKSVVGGKLVLDATTYKNGMISLLDKIKSQIIEGSGTYANPNLKVVLLSYAICNPTGGAYHILGQGEFGNGMVMALAYYQYYLVNNELSAMPDYADFVESVFVSHEVDSENAYAYIDKQVNAYMADTEKEYIENVHPNIIGYKMYGQAVARDILSRI